MSNGGLTHRQRVRLALERRPTDRIPIAMVCAGLTAPARAAFEQHLRATRDIGVDDYLRPLLDIRAIDPPYVGPPLGENEDIWSVVRKPVSYGAGHYMEIDHHPLAAARDIDDLADHRWPSTDWFDYDALPAIADRLNADEPVCLIGPGGNPFETTWYMRGFQQTFMDMVLEEAMFDYAIGRVTDFFIAHSRRILETIGDRVDLMFTADDIGGQTGLLMAPDLWRRRIQPSHRRLNGAIHEFGARVVYHSDGAVMDAVEDLIDMGVDVLQALQFDAEGMDPQRLKDDFGDRLCFEGGVSVQKTLPFGSPEQARREVRRLIDVLGRGGGYILGPSHAVQAGTPPANIEAMFEAAAASL